MGGRTSGENPARSLEREAGPLSYSGFRHPPSVVIVHHSSAGNRSNAARFVAASIVV